MIRKALITACIGLFSTTAFAGGGCDWTLKDTTTTQYGSDSLKVERFDCVYPPDPSLTMDHPHYVGTLYAEGKEPIVLEGWWNTVKPINLDLDLKGFRAIHLSRWGTSHIHDEIWLFNDHWELVEKVIEPTGKTTELGSPSFREEDGRILIGRLEPDGVAVCNACQEYYTAVYELTEKGLVYYKAIEPNRTKEDEEWYQSRLFQTREEYLEELRSGLPMPMADLTYSRSADRMVIDVYEYKKKPAPTKEQFAILLKDLKRNPLHSNMSVDEAETTLFKLSMKMLRLTVVGNHDSARELLKQYWPAELKVTALDNLSRDNFLSDLESDLRSSEHFEPWMLNSEK